MNQGGEVNTNEGDVSWPSITDIQRKLFLGAGVAMQIKAMYAPSIQSIEQQRDDLRAQVKRLQRAIHEATNIGIHVASIIHPDGTETKRGPYGEGWNAHAIKVVKAITAALEERDWPEFHSSRGAPDYPKKR